MITFQELIRRLSKFWEEKGCIIHQGYDLEMGAGTFNPATFLRCLGPEPYNAAYVEPSRRPTDGRYGDNPNRVQHFFQYQVILKPSPPDIQELYLESLKSMGIKLEEHDIRFVHDDWESPTLGAWGLGWEVWIDGMEVTQFTYFQSVGGIDLMPITGEITYGSERLAMYIQKVDSIFDLQWNDHLTYGDIYHRSEVEWSKYNFEEATVEMWWRHFEDYETEAKRLMDKKLPLPAYDFVCKASHAFNLLDARGVISVTERTGYIARIRNLSCSIAAAYVQSRKDQGFPLIKAENNNVIENISQKETPKTLSFDPNKKRDFILEVGSEELPATFVPIGCENLRKDMQKLLNKQGLSYGDIKVMGTPRRLSIYIKDLAEGTATTHTERKGPPCNAAFDAEGHPQNAGKGFFRSIGLKEIPSLEDIQSNKVPEISTKEIKGVLYLFVDIEKAGKATVDILSESLSTLILSLDFPKKMKWGSLDIAYARPLHWFVALFGDEIVPFSIAGIKSGRTSSGHRQLAFNAITIQNAEDYIAALKEHKVMVDTQERRDSILSQIESLEQENSFKILEKERVIPQVLNLSEWPLLCIADFDTAFLQAPKEVLISEMVEHQKYFPVSTSGGTLLNKFIITADNTPSNEIRRGNVKVISARLADGVFLYTQDLKTPLVAFNEKLKNITYQKELGSLFDKVLRIIENVDIIHKKLPIADIEEAKQAALLCKADLASELVYEFPNLQGTVGCLYATSQGEKENIAQAIDEHWMPRGEKAPLPKSPLGILLSLADKIDNLISCFSVGLKPTSSSDPYALRRQVLGIIKILIAGQHRLPLHEILESCYNTFKEYTHGAKLQNRANTIEEIIHFFTNRIKTVFQDYGLNKDEIEASLSSGFSDIYDSYCRAKALHSFRSDNASYPLLYEVFKRAKGQTANQEKQAFSPSHLIENAEINLHEELKVTEAAIDSAIERYDYDNAYKHLAGLQPHLAKLFDEVRILDNDKTIKDNRIALLNRLFDLFGKLLDFSKLQEHKKNR